MGEIKYDIGGTMCMLWGDDCFYTLVNGHYYKVGCLVKNNKCLVEYPTTTEDGHHGFIEIKKV